MPEKWSGLIEAALQAREQAYTPYSDYQVGAALLCEDGAVFTGCNVENASYPVCCCAERTALFKAVSEGKRRFLAVAVVGGKAGEQLPLWDYAHPCGVCRQALVEFSPEMTVITARSKKDYKEYKLNELIPKFFGPAQLDKGD